jgi:hypothetical protein
LFVEEHIELLGLTQLLAVVWSPSMQLLAAQSAFQGPWLSTALARLRATNPPMGGSCGGSGGEGGSGGGEGGGGEGQGDIAEKYSSLLPSALKKMRRATQRQRRDSYTRSILDDLQM